MCWGVIGRKELGAQLFDSKGKVLILKDFNHPIHRRDDGKESAHCSKTTILNGGQHLSYFLATGDI